LTFFAKKTYKKCKNRSKNKYSFKWYGSLANIASFPKQSVFLLYATDLGKLRLKNRKKYRIFYKNLNLSIFDQNLSQNNRCTPLPKKPMYPLIKWGILSKNKCSLKWWGSLANVASFPKQSVFLLYSKTVGLLAVHQNSRSFSCTHRFVLTAIEKPLKNLTNYDWKPLKH